MDGLNNEPTDPCSGDSSDDDKQIVNGFFGIVNTENNLENVTINSDFNNESKMDTNDDIKSNIDTSCKKTDVNHLKTTNNDESCVTVEVEEKNKNAGLATNNFFSTHIIGSKPIANSNHSTLPSSFATISENYENSMNDVSKNLTTVISTNSCDVVELDSKPAVLLPKENVQSLSMISNNYQDSSSDSDESSDDDDDNNYFDDSDDNASLNSASSTQVQIRQSVKTKGELDITDLPPIEDLKISVDEDQCQPVGCIKNIVDTLVIVEAFLNQPALDIDSILFIDRGQRALGKIFDVFGPVNKPHYAVRFNNTEHIKKFNILIKEPVFCAPKTEYSNFVLVSQLLQMKGSDASWKHNNEPPQEFVDYSDDEAEKLAKKNRKQKKKQKANDGHDESPGFSGQSVTNNGKCRAANVQHNASAGNFNQTRQTRPPRPPKSNSSANYNPHPANYPRPSNFNFHPPNFNPGQPNYGYNQRQYPTYAQQLGAMEYNHFYRPSYNPPPSQPQPPPPPPHYYNQNMYPPRPPYAPPYPHPPLPRYEHQTYPPQQTANPNDPNQQMHYFH